MTLTLSSTITKTELELILEGLAKVAHDYQERTPEPGRTEGWTERSKAAMLLYKRLVAAEGR